MAYRHHQGVYDPKFKKNSQRRELEDLMSEWYGSRFAALEITKRTDNASPVSESMDKILEKYLNKNSMQSLTLQENWAQIVGAVLNKFTSLAALKDNKVIVEPSFMSKEEIINLKGEYSVLSAVENEITTDKCDLLQGLINAVKDKLNNSLTDRESLIPLYVKKSQAEEGL